MQRDKGPNGFDNPEWPCALQESVDGSQSTRAGESHDEPGTAIFQRIEDQHRGDGGQAEEGEVIQKHRFIIRRRRISPEQFAAHDYCYEYFPHARSVAHQITLLPNIMKAPSAIHANMLLVYIVLPKARTGITIAT
jgi:hypothetical protein